MKRLLLLIISICLSVLTFASGFDTIYLRDGSAFYGFISSQDLAGNIEISFQSATVIMPQNQVEEDSDRVSFAGKMYDADILERGDEYKVRLYCESYGKYKTSIKEIVRTERAIIDDIEDVITLKNGDEYVGNILEVVRGEYIRILVNGEVMKFFSNNIVKQEKKAKDLNEFKMSAPLIEEYELKDSSILDGWLISQNNESGELVFLRIDGSKSKKNIRSVVSISRKINEMPDKKKQLFHINGVPRHPYPAQIDKDGDSIFFYPFSEIICPVKSGAVDVVMPLSRKESCIMKLFDPCNVCTKDNNFVIISDKANLDKNNIEGKVIRRGNSTVGIRYSLEAGKYYVLFDKDDPHFLVASIIWVLPQE